MAFEDEVVRLLLISQRSPNNKIDGFAFAAMPPLFGVSIFTKKVDSICIRFCTFASSTTHPAIHLSKVCWESILL